MLEMANTMKPLRQVRLSINVEKKRVEYSHSWLSIMAVLSAIFSGSSSPLQPLSRIARIIARRLKINSVLESGFFMGNDS